MHSKHVKPYPQKLSWHATCFNEFCGRCLIFSMANALALAYALKKVRKPQSKELCWTKGRV
jgi:late competence protein required for DNA uptake (superfamily II DNA/RNA helicase)